MSTIFNAVFRRMVTAEREGKGVLLTDIKDENGDRIKPSVLRRFVKQVRDQRYQGYRFVTYVDGIDLYVATADMGGYGYLDPTNKVLSNKAPKPGTGLRRVYDIMLEVERTGTDVPADKILNRKGTYLSEASVRSYVSTLNLDYFTDNRFYTGFNGDVSITIGVYKQTEN